MILIEIIEISREQLFHEREARVHPLKDDKILTDWNGLMIAALALGGQILNEKNTLLQPSRQLSLFIKIYAIKMVV